LLHNNYRIQRIKKKPKPAPVDEDPDGEALWNVDDPLGEATKFLSILRANCPQQLDAHLLACEVYLRKKKFLLVLQALKKATQISPNHPQVHQNKIRLFHEVSRGTVHENVQRVINFEAEHLLGKQHTNLRQVNDDFLEKNKHSYPHRVAVAETLLYLDPSNKQTALNLVLDTSGTGCTHQLCAQVYETLKNLFNDSNAAEEYKAKCHKLFPLTPFFAPKSADSALPNDDDANGE